MKLRLNLQGNLVERLRVSQTVVSRVILCWLDLMEESMRCYLLWLPRKTNNGSVFQRESVIDCSETSFQKPQNSHYYGQNTIKYLVSIAPCGLIMFISPAYAGRRSNKFITANSGFLEYLRLGDEVMADRGFTFKGPLNERKVMLLPAFTKRDMQLSEEDTTNTRRMANVWVHAEQVILLKN